MSEQLVTAGYASGLAYTAERLGVLAQRVEEESLAQPLRDPGGWDGPASWACQLSLELLGREVAAAVELLRCAAGLTAVSAWKARGSA